MKFRCECGTVIRDQTDPLPYKAHFIADQDYNDLIELLETELARVADIVEQGSREDGTARRTRAVAVESAKWALHRYLREYAGRVLYQCPHCGRLDLDD